MEETEKIQETITAEICQSDGYRVLFSPYSLITALTKLGKKPKAEIFPRSHKCEFRNNSETLLTDFRIRTNTYAMMAKRSWRQEQRSGVLLKECLTPFVWGIEAAAHCPTFFDNYHAIRDGLYALMICYSDDNDVKQVIAAIIDCLPANGRLTPSTAEIEINE